MGIRHLGALAGIAAMIGLFGACSPPTAEQACQSAADTFNKCAKGPSEKWGDRQIGICKGDFAASTTMKDYTKTLKKCSQMADCEIAKKCMMTILVAVGNDAKKGKR
jgi:hypothetical protein